MVRLLTLVVACLLAPSLVCPAPKSHFSCTTDNRPVVVIDHSQKDAHEVEYEDWYVICTITLDSGTVIFKRELAAAHPTSFPDAMLAIQEWIKKQAPKIVEEYTKRPKE